MMLPLWREPKVRPCETPLGQLLWIWECPRCDAHGCAPRKRFAYMAAHRHMRRHYTPKGKDP